MCKGWRSGNQYAPDCGRVLACDSEPGTYPDLLPLPNPSADLLSSLAISSSCDERVPSSKEADDAIAAAVAAPSRVHIDTIGEAAAACAARGHWSALSALLQVKSFSCCCNFLSCYIVHCLVTAEALVALL